MQTGHESAEIIGAALQGQGNITQAADGAGPQRIPGDQYAVHVVVRQAVVLVIVHHAPVSRLQAVHAPVGRHPDPAVRSRVNIDGLDVLNGLLEIGLDALHAGQCAVLYGTQQQTPVWRNDPELTGTTLRYRHDPTFQRRKTISPIILKAVALAVKSIQPAGPDIPVCVAAQGGGAAISHQGELTIRVDITQGIMVAIPHAFMVRQYGFEAAERPFNIIDFLEGRAMLVVEAFVIGHPALVAGQGNDLATAVVFVDRAKEGLLYGFTPNFI